MKRTLSILGLTVALLAAWALPAVSGETVSSKRLHLVTDDAGSLEVDLAADGDLEIGEIREYWTDEDQKVILERTEDGYRFDIDGKIVDIPMSFGAIDVLGDHGEHKMMFIHEDVEDGADGERRVIVKRQMKGEPADGEAQEVEVKVLRGSSSVWVDDDGKTIEVDGKKIFIDRQLDGDGNIQMEVITDGDWDGSDLGGIEIDGHKVIVLDGADGTKNRRVMLMGSPGHGENVQVFRSGDGTEQIRIEQRVEVEAHDDGTMRVVIDGEEIDLDGADRQVISDGDKEIVIIKQKKDN